MAGWGDWWPMAAQTLWQRGLTIAIFALVLALVVQLVRKAVDQRSTAAG
jgi:chromate transport protein ChrA